MSASTSIQRGPRFHRFAIYLFSLVLSILLIWLGGFGLRDIDRRPAPEISDRGLLDRQTELRGEMETVDAALSVEEQRLEHLRQSTSASQETLNQLLGVWEKTLEQRREVSQAEKDAFARAQDLFLDNQEQMQISLGELQNFREARRRLDNDMRETNEAIAELQRPIIESHRRQIALLKFLALVPVAFIGVLSFIRMRRTNYAPLSHAYNAAWFILLIQVIHEHFPAVYYKYMFLAMAIAAVLGVLVYLIRQFSQPSRNWLLARYREAYQNAQCPVCRYSIVGQNMRSVSSPKRRKWSLTDHAQGTTTPYTCPNCGTKLFDECVSCQGLRHTLLPHCIHCGAGEDGAVAANTTEVVTQEPS